MDAFNKNRPLEIDPIDAFVGNRLRERRVFKGMSQDKLAKKDGVTFQQVQKYEKGHNRLSVSRLVHFATILETPPTWFLEGLPATNFDVSNDVGGGVSQHEVYELVRIYSKITEQRQREAFLKMMKVFVNDVCKGKA